MSNSRRHTPIGTRNSGDSARWEKKQARRRFRRIESARLYAGNDCPEHADIRRLNWDGQPKEDRFWFSGSENESRMMRK